MTIKLINRGFTLVELMVTLTIAALLLGYALPAFNGMMIQGAMTSRVNQFLLAVNYARSEAANLGGMVSVQSVDPGDTDNEWGMGYCVVAGNPGDCDPPVLQLFESPDGLTIDGTGGLDGIGTLSFNSRGILSGGNAGEIRLCSTDTDEDPGRSMFLNL
ncbi:MAG: GspH/FimT family pseudopilin, partial [Gammaproteobacteria bacterium]|nr:GspH/FimT family pseudopilin [Gammaproteobacteria bacterium]